MPARIFNPTTKTTVTLDARPDRADLRDRIYNPPLRALPQSSPPAQWITKYLSIYRAWGLILDQGKEGACTGFGLAAMINHLNFRQEIETAIAENRKPKPITPVSMRMIYHLARLYDEWPGEDYDGSSCRGAVKGWYHHGVCSEANWPYMPQGARLPTFVRPQPGWDQDAAERPLGSYYRIQRTSIADMQAAIHEVGAIYVSAFVHEGWENAKLIAAPQPSLSLAGLPTIPFDPDPGKRTGGHAFAIVGYDRDGFIVQNSWGTVWGLDGFARLTYEDWLRHGTDAWVAVMGAPVNGRSPSSVLSSSRTVSTRAPEMGRGLANGATAEASTSTAGKAALDTETITKHVVVLGNRGRHVQIRIEAENSSSAVEDIAYKWPKEYFANNPKVKPIIAIYMHGGLNNLSAGLTRAKIMGKAFQDNRIYPIFIAWQSGFLDSVGDILNDTFGDEILPNGGIMDDIAEGITSASDRLLEVTTGGLAGAIWSKIKDNAVSASESLGGMQQVIDSLAKLKAEIPALEVHAIGHSAGAILCGASLRPLVAKKLTYRTVSLYAPACTVEFANSTYLAQAGKAFQAADCSFDILSHKNEQDDSVGPYRKSLLYYVSRACEVHKTPILGLEAVWDSGFDNDALFISGAGGKNPDVVRWRKNWKGPAPKVLTDEKVVTNQAKLNTESAVHGCFDNAVNIVSQTVTRILGRAPYVPITSLDGF